MEEINKDENTKDENKTKRKYWQIVIGSEHCPFIGRKKSKLFFISRFRKKCHHIDYPNNSYMINPKCDENKCPIKIRNKKINYETIYTITKNIDGVLQEEDEIRIINTSI